MKAMAFPEAGRAEIVEVARPEVPDGHVLIKVRAAGICASDVAAFKGVHSFRRPPVITGHELAGEVIRVGAGSHDRRIGDRVALEPHVGCGHCLFCGQGHYHECPDKRFIGVGDWIGAFAEYVVATERMCHPMPAGMSFEEGALLEPFCVGLHAVRRADVRMGESAAILGVGTIGMMTLLAVRATTPGWVVVSDPSQAKRDLAVQCGASAGIDPQQQDVVQTTLAATGGLGVDVVFVAVASEDVLRQAVRLCRRMGRIVIIASFYTGGGVEARALQSREQVIIGTSMYTAVDYRLAAQLWEQGHLKQFPALVSERIPLDQAPATVAALARGERPDNMKTIIRFDEPRGT